MKMSFLLNWINSLKEVLDLIAVRILPFVWVKFEVNEANGNSIIFRSWRTFYELQAIDLNCFTTENIISSTLRNEQEKHALFYYRILIVLKQNSSRKNDKQSVDQKMVLGLQLNFYVH